MPRIIIDALYEISSRKSRKREHARVPFACFSARSRDREVCNRNHHSSNSTFRMKFHSVTRCHEENHKRGFSRTNLAPLLYNVNPLHTRVFFELTSGRIIIFLIISIRNNNPTISIMKHFAMKRIDFPFKSCYVETSKKFARPKYIYTEYRLPHYRTSSLVVEVLSVVIFSFW